METQTAVLKILLRMGTFHTNCNMLSFLGRDFETSAWSGIVADGSVHFVIDGKHYSRAVRAHI